MRSGDIVTVNYGGLDLAARVVAQAEPEDTWWLRVNVLGVTLPQMFREREMAVLKTPSEAARLGLCDICMGLGEVSSMIDGDQPCTPCDGYGREVDPVGDETVEQSVRRQA